MTTVQAAGSRARQAQHTVDVVAQGYEAFRENVLFLIDAQPAMLDKADIPDNTVCVHSYIHCAFNLAWLCNPKANAGF